MFQGGLKVSRTRILLALTTTFGILLWIDQVHWPIQLLGVVSISWPSFELHVLVQIGKFLSFCRDRLSIGPVVQSKHKSKMS